MKTTAIETQVIRETRSHGARPAASLLPSSRVFYLDSLRVVLTILVIAHHVGQAYGPTGGYWPVQEAARAAILGPFFTVNSSFFMSLFFMISGYFMVGAYQRNGSVTFIRGRLVRLGVPVLAFRRTHAPFAHLSLPRSYRPLGRLSSTRRTSGTSSTSCSSASSTRSGRSSAARRPGGVPAPRPAPPGHLAALLLVAVPAGSCGSGLPSTAG